MEPIALSGPRPKLFDGSLLVSDRRRYVDESDAPFQIVFSIISKTNEHQRREDLFNTCFRGTNSATEMSLFDCEDMQKYIERRCELVARSGSQTNCGEFRTKMRATLTRKKQYFLAVSMYDVPDDPKLVIKHGRTRTVAST